MQHPSEFRQRDRVGATVEKQSTKFLFEQSYVLANGGLSQPDHLSRLRKTLIFGSDGKRQQVAKFHCTISIEQIALNP